MRHLRTRAASIAIVAGLGILGVGCTDDETPPADETTAPADETTAPADETMAPTDGGTGTEVMTDGGTETATE